MTARPAPELGVLLALAGPFGNGRDLYVSVTDTSIAGRAIT